MSRVDPTSTGGATPARSHGRRAASWRVMQRDAEARPKRRRRRNVRQFILLIKPTVVLPIYAQPIEREGDVRRLRERLSVHVN